MNDELKIRIESLLRRAGLSRVPKPALACMLVAALVLAGAAVVRFWPQGAASTGDDFQVALAAQEDETSESLSVQSSGEIAVDVEGAVKHPGLYMVAAGSRIGDAIEAAGGVTNKAASGQVNLAQSLEDGQQVYVPSKQEGSSRRSSDSGSGSAGSGGATASSAGDKININTATAEELQALPGIGEALSQRIVDYRDANGAFSQVEDITNVSGIGDAILANIKDIICV